MSRDDDAETGRRFGGRKLAEWVTMGVSVVLVLGTAGYLVYLGLRADPPLVPVEVNVMIDRAENKDGRYVVPIEVRNRGRRTVKNLEVRLTQLSADGRQVSSEITIDYLGEGATAKAYVYLNRDPRVARPEAEPFSYQLE